LQKMTNKGRKAQYVYYLSGTRFVSLTKAAAAFQVSKSTITRWCQSRKKPDCFREPVKETARNVGQGVGTSPDMTPIEYLLQVMRDPAQPHERRDQAAHWLLPYFYPKATARQTGIKKEREEKAKAAGTGRFKTSQPPAFKILK
jgi:hypothetical protein